MTFNFLQPLNILIEKSDSFDHWQRLFLLIICYQTSAPSLTKNSFKFWGNLKNGELHDLQRRSISLNSEVWSKFMNKPLTQKGLLETF